MVETMKTLGVRHHISAPHHPEGHGVVERVNYVLAQALRAAIISKGRGWVDYLAAAAFAHNTVIDRVSGVEPARVVFGFLPRTPLHVEMDRDSVVVGNDLDSPTEFALVRAKQLLKIIDEVKQRESEMYQKMLLERAKKAKGRSKYLVGEYVLVHYPRTEKLSTEWRGPFIIEEAEKNGLVYVVKNLVDGSTFRAHVNRLHEFIRGNLTDDELMKEACRIDEYLVDEVLKHELRGDELWFRVRWRGYEDKGDEDSDSWVAFKDAKWSPVVKAYIEAHCLLSQAS